MRSGATDYEGWGPLTTRGGATDYEGCGSQNVHKYNCVLCVEANVSVVMFANSRLLDCNLRDNSTIRIFDSISPPRSCK